ncbi:unnamed protein product [Mytilus coruscus]|uniref:Tyr recombinase domain-containing protein n=1 Tax=Mytilus coruscus TaxID=42192 RepID=A0A6J8BF27_MYTCO|nr:unnamed protein product [Mytilus coruscus]
MSGYVSTADTDTITSRKTLLNNQRTDTPVQITPGKRTCTVTAGDDAHNDTMSVIEDMKGFMVTEEKAGPKINDELASVVNDGLRKKAKQNKVDELTKKYAKPENVHSLTVPKINLGIWSKMSVPNRMNDVKLQKIQNLLGKAACPMLYLMDLFLSKSQTNDGLSREEVQSATQTLRRALIQAEIQPKYKALCKDDVPVTDFLFGNDIKDKVKEMDAEYTVGKKLGKTNCKIGKKSHDDKKTFKNHMETNIQKEKVQKEDPRAGQEIPIKLPKHNSLPVSTLVQQLNTQFTFINTSDNFIGGKVKKFQENWMSLTSDNWVLDVVKGYQIEFEQIPSQNKEPNMLQFNTDETNMVQCKYFYFKTHSTRGASTSAALRAGVSVNTILKSAGWTNESTFRQFYNRPVTVQEYNDNYSVRVLRGK